MAAISWRKSRVNINEVDYVGQIKKGSVELKRQMTSLNGLGQPGEIKVPNGNFEAATAKIEWGSISSKDMRLLISKDGFINITFSGDCRGIDSLVGTKTQGTVTTTLRGYVEEMPTQMADEEGKSETETTVNLLYLEIKDKDGRILMIDWAKGLVEPAELA